MPETNETVARKMHEKRMKEEEAALKQLNEYEGAIGTLVQILSKDHPLAVYTFVYSREDYAGYGRFDHHWFRRSIPAPTISDACNQMLEFIRTLDIKGVIVKLNDSIEINGLPSKKPLSELINTHHSINRALIQE